MSVTIDTSCAETTSRHSLIGQGHCVYRIPPLRPSQLSSLTKIASKCDLLNLEQGMQRRPESSARLYAIALYLQILQKCRYVQTSNIPEANIELK